METKTRNYIGLAVAVVIIAGLFLVARADASLERSAEITSPVSGEEVHGSVNFEAYLNDDEPDSIHWAIRKDTCVPDANTVFGNIDGYSNDADIDTSDLFNQTFSFTGDMSNMTLGEYCFIYNPIEDGKESSIRKTLEFTLVGLPTPEPTPEVSNEPSVGDDEQTTDCTNLDALTEEQALGDCNQSKFEEEVKEVTSVGTFTIEPIVEAPVVQEELVTFPTTGGFSWF